MKIRQLYQNLAVSLGLVAALAGSYACGDGSEPNPNPNEDAQVEVDTGHDKDAGLEDKLVYPDANGDNIPNGDDIVYVDASDGGSDVYNLDGGDTLTDTYVQPDAGDVGGDVDLTDVLDGGYDANDTGGDVGDGGQGVPPVIIMETRDEQGNIKDTFKRGEMVVYDLNKSYDPDCSDKGTCGSSKGMDYCDWSDEFGSAGKIYFPPYDTGDKWISYGSPKDTVTATAKCYDLDDKLFSIDQATINLTD